jgi:hypothetical protein
MPELSREDTFRALRERRHYATTGSRMHLDVRTSFPAETAVFALDPVLGPSPVKSTESAVPMGAIVHSSSDIARVVVTLHAPAPVERIEIRNGRQVVHVHRPYPASDLGRRIRVVWSGAEYRGRFRMTTWDGRALLDGNAFERAEGLNFFNSSRPLERSSDQELSWRSVTTGNFSGFDATLRFGSGGTLSVVTPLGKIELAVDAIGLEPAVFEFGGLDRKIEIYRLPDVNPHLSASFEGEIALDGERDNPLYVSAVTEDGHQCWSSPVYAIPRPAWL